MPRPLFFALFLSVLAGCSEPEPPSPSALPPPTPELVRPYAYPPLSEARHAQACGPPPADAAPCERDEDCRICHDGSDCGVPVNLEQLRARGDACMQPDAADCEYSAVRCCAGRCTETPF